VPLPPGHLRARPRLPVRIGRRLDKGATHTQSHTAHLTLSLYYRYADKQRLTQRCTNAGCDYVTDIRDDFRKHIKDECAFAIVDCPDCGEKNLRRCDLAEHKANVCPMGTASCPLCAAVVKRSELETHQRTDCPNRLVPCPRECGEWMR